MGLSSNLFYFQTCFVYRYGSVFQTLTVGIMILCFATATAVRVSVCHYSITCQLVPSPTSNAEPVAAIIAVPNVRDVFGYTFDDAEITPPAP